MNDESLHRFLMRNFLHPDCYDVPTETLRFQEEMNHGLQGEVSSLLMLPTFLTLAETEKKDCKILVLDAGGTNLRVGVAAVRGGRIAEIRFDKCSLPGSEEALSKDAFFDHVAAALAPYLHESDRVGFCFSYAAECLENHDARLKAFCKEVQVYGAEGVEICHELDAAIRRRGITKTYRYVQLNDTVATLLGGMAGEDSGRYSDALGVILGTGMNVCYLEKTANITKYKGDFYREERMIVNMEAGCYAGFPKGVFDHEVDAASQIPGDHQLEKLVSGAYLGNILLTALCAAAREGLLSATLGERLRTRTELPLPEVGAFLHDGTGEFSALVGDDAPAVRTIIAGIYSRAARLLAIVFAAVARQNDTGRDRPVCIVLEGSTYQKTKLIQDALHAELEVLRKETGREYVITSAANATLTGAAYAALTNL